MSRTCILVSPYFPPSTLAGVHRARHLAKHLPAAGWTPVVLCVDEAYHEEHLDPGLLSLVPPSIEIVKVKALPASLTRFFGIGEISLRAWSQLRTVLFRLLATRQIGAVFITGSPYYPMLLASEIKRRFGIPVILDFQDPWVSAWGAGQPRWSKIGISHLLATWLEPRAIQAADFITSVSEIQNAEMAARYQWVDRSRMAAIPIGGDPDDYEALRASPPLHEFDFAPGFINLSYVGTIWPPAMDTVRALIRALTILRARMPIVYEKVRLNFVGTGVNPNDKSGNWIRPIAEAAGVAEIIRETPQRVPYLEALSIQDNSDGVLMLGSNEPHYTASKIYSVLMSRRPFLSVFHRDSSSHVILSGAAGGIALAFSSGTELLGLDGQICDALVRLATSPERLGQVDPAAYAPYTAEAIAAKYAEIFDGLDRARTRR